MKHLIFYDQPCPLCNRAVRFVLRADTKEEFGFAPLDGETATKELQGLYLKHPDLDTLVLLQDYGEEKEQTLIEGKAVLRIFWLLRGKYTLIGWLSFLPSPLFDWMYRIVARHRYKIFPPAVPYRTDPNRFLK